MTSTEPQAATQGHYADLQHQIYFAGLADTFPEFPVAAGELEASAYAAMPATSVGYVAGSAGAEATARANLAAFDRWRIVPRMLRGITTRHLATSVLGTPTPAPVLLGPVGVQSIVHPDAESATARAAAAVGLPFVLSTASSTPMEAVAAAAEEVRPGAPRWYQLYWPKDREVAASFVARAEAAGYTAVVVTLDTWSLGWRPRDLEHAYLPFLRGVGLANYTSDPVFASKVADDTEASQILLWASMFGDPSLTWDDIAWLRERTRLPIVLKGICDPGDARLAAEVGADAVIVSNHGGRQVDGAVAALDALIPVVDALGGRLPVLFDSGIRTGADAVKALALGADAVLLGRLYLWGLALGGAKGVEHVLRTFLADLDSTLALSGHASPADLSRDSLQEAP